MPENSAPAQPTLVVHGLDLSYFTGKLEAYLRVRGIAHECREMTTRSFRDCARATGVQQMPQVELPDGTWLTDTTLTIRHLEATVPGPGLTPTAPVARFIALVLEDFGDEALWRPALYYRWAFADDARLMSARLARGMLRDVPLPFAVRRQFILRRQQLVYLRRDGVTRGTRSAIETLYLATLDAMERALAHQPFVMGARPTIADIGLFGSMYRHFFSDPTPARLMRAQAPRTQAWVARLWALSPGEWTAHPPVEAVPEALRALLALVTSVHLPELEAHATACAEGRAHAAFETFGTRLSVPASPYRAWCLDELRRAFQTLEPAGRDDIAALLQAPKAIALLSAAPRQKAWNPPTGPVTPAAARKPLDRNWNTS